MIITEKDWDLIHARTPEETKKLLAYGAHINAQDTDGKTALIWTIENHDSTDTEAQVKMLIKMGAAVDAKDKKGYTALSYAREVYSTREVYSEEKQAMFKRIIDMLIEAGADVNAKAKYSSQTNSNKGKNKSGIENTILTKMRNMVNRD